MPSTKLGRYLEEKKIRKQLKKQYQDDSTRFTNLFKETIPLVAKLPEKDRSAGQGQLQEFRDRLQSVKLESGMQARVNALTLLIQDLQNWKNAKSNPTPTLPPTGTAPLKPQPPTPDDLQQQVNDLAEALTNAGVAVPPLVQALTTGKHSADALNAVLAVKGTLIGFAEHWQSGQRVETQAQKNQPQGVKLFDAVHTTWDTERNQAKDDWEQLADAKNAAEPGKLLYGAEVKARTERERLLRLREGATQRFAQADQRMSELGKSKLYDLTAASRQLQQARNAYDTADTDTALNNALTLLDGALQKIQQAEVGAAGPKAEALAAFNKLRQKLLEEIAKCGKLRGANIDGSAVKKKLDEARALLQQADDAMQLALTSGQAVAAAKPLQDALALKLYDTASKLAEKEKKNAESDLKALPEYQGKFAALQQARARVAEISGAHGQLQTLDALILQVRVDGSGRPPGGFAKALEAIKNGKLEQLEKDATKAEKQFTMTLPTTALPKLEEAREALLAFEKNHTPFEVAEQRRALAAAAGGNDPTTALANLAAALDQAATDRGGEKTTAELAIGKLRTDLAELEKDGLPATDPRLLGLRTACDRMAEACTGWRIADAQRELKDCQEMATQARTDLDKARNDWTQQKSLLETFRTLAAPLVQTPQLGFEANSAVVGIDNVLQGVANKTLTFEEAVQRAKNVLAGEPALRKHLTTAGLDGREATELQAYGKEAQRLAGLWNNAVAGARLKVDALDEALKAAGVKNGAGSTPFPGKLTALAAQFEVRSKKLAAETGKDPKEALRKLFEELLVELNQLTPSLPDPKAPQSQAFTGVAGEAKKKETQDSWLANYNKAKQLLAEAEALNGSPLPDLGKALGSYDEKIANATLGKKWADLTLTIGQKVIELRREANNKKGSARIEAAELKKMVGKKLLDRQSVTFRGLFDDIGKRVDDALAMLESDDATLIAAANRQLAEIRLTLTEAKGKGDKNAITLEQVQKRWADLSHVIGDGAIVQERLPATYRRLKGELDAAIELAKRTPPDQGMAALEKIRPQIMEARKAAKLTQQRYEGYKLRREALEGQLDQVKEHTGTTLGNRMTAYNERFAARVGEANALAKQEGQLDAAYKALADLENELGALLKMSPDAAKVDLQTKNAEAETEQRELRDLARNWNTTQEFWENTLLPAVDKAVAEREDDDTEAQSLRAALVSIGKTLDPYLAVISKLPHKRAGANGAPEMKGARAAFSQAFARLAQLQKTAVRLRDGGGNTNVDLERDLATLAQDWSQRVKAAQDALLKLASSVKAMPSLASATQGEPNYLSDDDKNKLTDAANALEPMLARLGGRFQDSAFSAPLATLGSDKSAPAARLKAREEAIRLTRQMATDIVDNPLFQSLFEGAGKGLLDVDVRQPLAQLRAGLKKIELAVLVGV